MNAHHASTAVSPLVQQVSVREEFRNITLEARINADGRLGSAKGRTQDAALELADLRANEGGNVKGMSKTKQKVVEREVSLC